MDDTSSMSPEEIQSALSAPAAPESLGVEPVSTLSDEQLDNLASEYDKQQKYGGRPLTTAAASALSTATFSLSDRALIESGLVQQEDLAELYERNKGADIVGSVVGIAAPIIATLGAATPEALAGASASAAGKAALKTAAKAAAAPTMVGSTVERSLAKALGEAAAASGQKKLVKEIVKKSIAQGAGSAVEGSVYGLNQLLREDALGKAELNAENLIDYMGEGALLGGAMGAALAPGGVLLREAGAGIGRGAKKAVNLLVDTEKDATKLMGMTPAQVAKFRDKNPKFIEGLPDWIKTRLNLSVKDDATSLLSKMDNVEATATKSMDNAILQLDEAAKAQNKVIGSGIYRELAKDIEDRFVSPYSGMKSMQQYAKTAKNIVSDLNNLASTKKVASFSELRDLRIKMDKLAKGFFKAADPTEGAQAAFATRDVLKKTINKYAESIDPRIAKTLTDANKDYHYVSVLKKGLGNKAERLNDFVSYKDAVLGGIGYGIGDVTGLGLAAAKKFIDSDLKRKMVILTNVEKGNKSAMNRIGQSVKTFFEKSGRLGRAGRPASISVLMNSGLARDEKKKELPKNRAAAFDNIKNNVSTIIGNPDALTERVARATSVLGYAAPATAQAMGTTMVRAANFLASKMPKNATSSAGAVFERPYQPSDMELSRFERYLQVVEKPLSVLKDLEAGTLTNEHVEALQAVYPNLYNEIRVATLEHLKDKPNMSYNKKLQLGMLLNIPTDATMDPEFILQMQRAFAPAQEAQAQSQAAGAPMVQPSQSGASSLDMANRAQTDAQAVASRE